MNHLFSKLVICLLSVGSFSLQAHDKAPQTLPQKRPQIEVAFVLDTTGSMGGLIAGAKQKIWSIAKEITSANNNPEVKFGLIGYRDRQDTYITQVYDLTDDLDALYAKLMQFEAAGGGDSPESVNQALQESITRLSWSEKTDTLKIVFLVGDAPPHMDYQDDVKYPDSCKLANVKGIIINTIQCGSMQGTREIWQEIAQHAQGEYVAIQQSGGMHAIHTPVDDAIAKLNRDMAATVITYGDASAQSLGRSKVSNALSSSPEVAAERYNYFANTNLDTDEAPTAISGNEDLVTQIVKNEITEDEIQNKLLPEALKSLSPAELNAHIAEQATRRKAIQAKLNTLLAQRQTFIDSEKAKLEAEGKSDGFDSKVNSLIRKQAATKGITYGN